MKTTNSSQSFSRLFSIPTCPKFVRVFLVLLSIFICYAQRAADLYDMTVEVYNTGGIGLRAWTDICSGTHTNKPDGSRGLVTSLSSELCDSNQRWKIKWPGEQQDRWSAENWLRVVPPDLTILGSVIVVPTSVSPGGTIDLSCTIKNIGGGNARASGTAIQILRLADNMPIVSESMIETSRVPSESLLGFGYRLRIPDTTPAGWYYAQVTLDSLNSIGQIERQNDTKASLPFRVTGTFDVNATANEGGTIEPSGSNKIAEGQNVAFKAIPLAGYDVAEWLLDGETTQTGGREFAISNVSANHVLQVTFKQLTHSIKITGNNGTVVILPNLIEYPHGGEVIVTAIPDPNYWLYDWRGDIRALGNEIRFKVMGDIFLQANFQPIHLPVSMEIANSTPRSSINLTFPATSGYSHVVQVSDDFMFSWRNSTLITGDTSSSFKLEQDLSNASQIMRCVDIPTITTPPFLRFPVTNTATHQPYTSETTPVSSIFDHHGPMVVPTPYTTFHDGAIQTYKGEVITINNALTTGFSTIEKERVILSNFVGDSHFFDKKLPDGSSAFTLIAMQLAPSTLARTRFNYVADDHLIYYDGHTGYDYVVGGNGAEHVRAAAEGYLIPEDYDCYNTISIDHCNGYKTCYLHMRWEDIDPDLKKDGRLIRKLIKAGQILGLPGDVMGCQGQKGGIHLHFEVRKKFIDSSGKEIWMWVDPYGLYATDDSELYPPLWLPGE